MATRHMSNMKFPVLRTLKLCQNCRTVPAGHRNIRTLQTNITRGQCRELHWTLHQRHLLRLPKHTRILVSQFSTSPHIFSPDEDGKKMADRFKDDPEAREFVKEMTQDFSSEQEKGSTRTSVLSEFKDESDTESSSTSDSEKKLEKDSSKRAATPNITEKSEYIIMQGKKGPSVPIAQEKHLGNNREVVDWILLEAMSKTADEHAFNALMYREMTMWDEGYAEEKERLKGNLIFNVTEDLLGADSRKYRIHDVVQKYFSGLGFPNVDVNNIESIERRREDILRWKITLNDEKMAGQLLRAKRGRSWSWIDPDLPPVHEKITEHNERECDIRNQISVLQSDSWRWKIVGKRVDWARLGRMRIDQSKAKQLADELSKRVKKIQEMGEANNEEMEARRKREKFLIFRNVAESVSNDSKFSLLRDTYKVKDLFETLHLDYGNVKKIMRRGTFVVVELNNPIEKRFSTYLLRNSRWNWMNSVKIATGVTFLQKYISILRFQEKIIRECLDTGTRLDSIAF